MKKVLVVDDEPSILTLLTFNLQKEGYAVTGVPDGREAYERALGESFDFIILDLMLPGMDGMEICRKLRREKVDTPILMLTAKDDELEKIIGLELGADDYMTKPFSPREVLARMKAVWRRVQPAHENNASAALPEKAEQTLETGKISAGDLEIFPEQYEVRLREEPVELTPKEFELLLYMAERPKRVLHREQLLQAVWNFEHNPGETRIVDVHISRLREKLEEDTKNPHYIKTIRGFGYKFEVPQK